MIVKAEDEFTNLLFNKVIMDWLGGKLHPLHPPPRSAPALSFHATPY